MKYDKEFKEFLKQNTNTNYYYYDITYVNVIKGNKDKDFYEVFVDNINELENKEDCIIMRFMTYLDEHDIRYDFEELYYDTLEYVSVYDRREMVNE